MHYVVVILLALLGAVEYGEGGFLFGGLLGVALALVWSQRRQLNELKARVDALGEPPPSVPVAETTAASPTPAPEPAADPWTPAQASVADTGPDAPRKPPHAPRAAGVLDDRLEAAVAAVKRFFTTGNLVVRVGVVVLFFGVAFLLRYAYENSLVPVQLRLVGTALGGVGLAVLGWRLRRRSDTYGLVLQGAGVGLLYLTVFAAGRLYELIPIVAALVALVVLVAASSVLAVVQRSQALAIFSMTGGFLAPVLVSTGGGSHVALFSYYALLNTGILGMAWFRHWRWLNWVGFVFTFAIGALWGYEYYEPRHFATVEPFLLLFFLYYIAVSVLFARRHPVDLKGVIDGTLVFGTPVIAFALQAALVRDIPFGLAYSALGAAVTYTLLALWLNRQGAFATLLGQSFIALGVAFATLAIPFAFDDQRYTAATWALEGAGLVWVGLRQGQRLPRLAGVALQGGAALAFLADWYRGPEAVLFANSAFFGALMVALGALFTGFQLDRAAAERAHRYERLLGTPFVFWGVAWWLGGAAREIAEFEPWWYARFEAHLVCEHLFVLFTATSLAALTGLARRLTWRAGLTPGFLLLPLGVIMGAVVAIESLGGNPLADLGWLAWPALGATVLWHLREVQMRRPAAAWHALGWWSAALFLGWVGYATIDAWLPDSVWSGVQWGLGPAVIVAALLAVRHRAVWPLEPWVHSYFGWGMAVMMVYLLAWTVATGLVDAAPDPLPYVVLVNPLEVVQLTVLMLALHWTRVVPDSVLARRVNELRAAIAVAAFAWLNLTAARAVHAYAGVPYPIDRIIEADVFQTTVSILWTLAAVLLMSLGARRTSRPSWIVGAVLLGLVIVKLFVVDLSNLETVARIVSFVTVGVLMLVIGYLAPLPPSRQPEATT